VIGRFLEGQSFRCGVLHGGRTQDQRENTLDQFRAGQYNVLVATDVAGRGLDIPDVTHVINFDMPMKIENYTHRIGRTGRAGKSGLATSFLTDNDEDVMFDLKQYLISTESTVPPQLANHQAARAPPGARREDGSLMAQKKDSVVFAKK
jgi:ATP-dependent RNA helicase DDX23/PRP28